MINEKKIERLAEVARLYYEEDKSQNEIANIIGVSRPMVSKLLTEGRNLGVVTIKINYTKEKSLGEKIKDHFGIDNVVIIDYNKQNEEPYKKELSNILIKEFFKYKNINLGIGCGSSIGILAEEFETRDKLSLLGKICPLIGGFKATFKSYHTNELVRSLSERTGLAENYLYLPAILPSQEEKELYKDSELYMQIEKLWNNLDVAVVNISSLYAPPDLATSARFGKKLIEQKAVGRFLAHYYNIKGEFIEANMDNVAQVGVNTLKKAKKLFAICSNSSDVKSIVGAFNTKMFSTIVLNKDIAQEIVAKYCK